MLNTQQKLFGTDGIRTTVGKEPLTPDSLVRLGYALGQWATKTYGENPTILLGSDTRESYSWVKATLQSGLLRWPVTIYDAGVLATPAVCSIAQNSISPSNKKFDFAVIISASHNIYSDNGIKLFDAQTGKLDETTEDEITQLFYQDNNSHVSQDLLVNTNFGQTYYWPEARHEYTQRVMQFFKKDFLTNRTVVLDCAHGATADYAPKLFMSLGAKVIALAHNPNGKNINDSCGALHPETLVQKVIEHKADIGFAFDGDGDRITVVTASGLIRTGDEILALLTTHPRYIHENNIVGTILSNQGLANYLSQQNKQLLRTPVGDKYIAQKLSHIDSLLGGEPSGHIITRDFLNVSDGIFVALRLCEIIIFTDNLELNSFIPYPTVNISIPVSYKKDLKIEPFTSIINQYEKKITQGQLIIRYSGTEPVLRVMIEAENIEFAHNIGNELAQELLDKLT